MIYRYYRYRYLFDNMFVNGHKNIQVGSGSMYPNPKEIFTDPQQWLLQNCK